MKKLTAPALARTQAILTGLALVIAFIAALTLRPGAEDASKVTRFLGKFHLLTLHVPIGVLVLTLTAESLTLLRRHRRRADLVVGFALPFLVLTGLAALLLGLCLAHGGDYPAKLIGRHRNLTLAGICLAGITTIAWPYRRRAGRMIHRGLLGATALVLSVGAHFGGTITHGADYLFPAVLPAGTGAVPETDAGAADEPHDAPAPDGTADGSTDAGPVATMATDADTPAPRPDADAGVLTTLDAGRSAAGDAAAPAVPRPSPRAAAQAILLRRCAPCHTLKANGGLRVTDLTKLKAGAVVPGQAAASPLYTRLTLPKDDDDHMPPVDKPQPTGAELATLRTWINELKGAP